MVAACADVAAKISVVASAVAYFMLRSFHARRDANGGLAVSTDKSSQSELGRRSHEACVRESRCKSALIKAYCAVISCRGDAATANPNVFSSSFSVRNDKHPPKSHHLS